MDINNISEKDLYWLVGLLEGEGSFMVLTSEIRRKGGTKLPINIQISMSDKDIMEKVSNIFKTKVHIDNWAQKQNPKYKIQFKTIKVGWQALQLMQKIYPLMGIRRKEQIIKCFNICNLDINNKLPNKTNGHCKLTKEQVIEIRKRFASGEGPYRIAKDFPITGSHCSNICYNRRNKLE